MNMQHSLPTSANNGGRVKEKALKRENGIEKVSLQPTHKEDKKV